MIKYLLLELGVDPIEYDWILDFLTDYAYTVVERLYNRSESIENEETSERLSYNLVKSGYGLEWLEKSTTVIKHPTEERYKVVQK